jgi:hypothetical protein
MGAILRAVRHESLGKRYKAHEMKHPEDCAMCPLNAFCGMKYIGTHRAVSRCPNGTGLSSPCLIALPPATACYVLSVDTRCDEVLVRPPSVCCLGRRHPGVPGAVECALLLQRIQPVPRLPEGEAPEAADNRDVEKVCLVSVIDSHDCPDMSSMSHPDGYSGPSAPRRSTHTHHRRPGLISQAVAGARVHPQLRQGRATGSQERPAPGASASGASASSSAAPGPQLP